MSEPIIAIRGLRKTYRIGKVDLQVLRGVDLDVAKGEFLSIIGPSGSGKVPSSTLLVDSRHPRQASVVVAGQNLLALDDAGRTRLRKKTVSFVFQKFNLLPNLTARDNIELARYLGGNNHHSAADPSFVQALELLGIANRLHHKPAELSGGEQQRVAIARAIVNHPSILLADEPTGNLDTQNSNTVLEILRDLNERLGQTILMITHNPEAAAYGHRTVQMRDGSAL